MRKSLTLIAAIAALLVPAAAAQARPAINLEKAERLALSDAHAMADRDNDEALANHTAPTQAERDAAVASGGALTPAELEPSPFVIDVTLDGDAELESRARALVDVVLSYDDGSEYVLEYTVKVSNRGRYRLVLEAE